MGIIAWIYEPYRESHDTDFHARSAGNDRIMVSSLESPVVPSSQLDRSFFIRSRCGFWPSPATVSRHQRPASSTAAGASRTGAGCADRL